MDFYFYFYIILYFRYDKIWIYGAHFIIIVPYHMDFIEENFLFNLCY